MGACLVEGKAARDWQQLHSARFTVHLPFMPYIFCQYFYILNFENDQWHLATLYDKSSEFLGQIVLLKFVKKQFSTFNYSNQIAQKETSGNDCTTEYL